MFDPQTFLEQSVPTGFDTQYKPCPPGEYQGIINKLNEPRVLEGKDGRDDSVVMDIQWEILDDEVRKTLDMEEVFVRQSVFLDIDESGGLARGPNKNITYGRLLEATRLNDGSDVSPIRLVGQGPCLVKVEHDKTGQYANVTRVSPIT